MPSQVATYQVRIDPEASARVINGNPLTPDRRSGARNQNGKIGARGRRVYLLGRALLAAQQGACRLPVAAGRVQKREEREERHPELHGGGQRHGATVGHQQVDEVDPRG